MSNVISFLEKMGQDAQLRHATKNEMELALSHAKIDPELQTAIFNKDQVRLEAILGARTNVLCALGVPDDDDDKKDEPMPDDDEIVLMAPASHRVAWSG